MKAMDRIVLRRLLLLLLLSIPLAWHVRQKQ
jgi:hypothetical protein